MTNIGLCGSHRTGKTTLAEIVAKRAGISFVRTSTSAVFEQLGLDPAKRLEFSKRLYVQNKILDAAEKIWFAEESQFITDRTPLDMMAYTLADIQGETAVNPSELEEYLDRCFDTTNKLFRMLFLIQPGISLVRERGKAALNGGYIEHLNFLILGLCSDARVRSTFKCLPRNATDMESRVNFILDALGTSNPEGAGNGA